MTKMHIEKFTRTSIWDHGLIIHPNGTNFIVVTGGLLGDNSDVSEILDVNDIESGWFSGKRDKFKYIWFF